MKQVQIIGNVGGKPVQRTSANGKVFYTFSVAVSNGENSTLWFSCVINGDPKVVQYLDKGKQVYVQGDLQLSLYKGNIDASVYVNTIQLCGKRSDSEPTQPQPSNQPTNQPTNAPDVY